MGTTIAGNQHAGTVFKEMQYVWAPGIGGDNQVVELFEEDGFYVYQFNPLYDQRDDGILAVEFYYYYHKPDTQAFWTYVYDPDRYYIVPFLAWYYDEGNVGQFGTLISDAPKISLVGRESGWIHITLHVDEAIYGQYVSSQGKLCQNPVYFGIYSPLLNFCYDTSVTHGERILPYHLEFDYGDEEDYDVYDFLTGGYMEDFYWRRTQKNMYPSFYITYRDVTPEAFNYAVNEQSVINVSSSVTRKSVLKKLLSEIKAITGTAGRHQLHIRIAGNNALSVSDAFAKRLYFSRLLSETKSMAELLSRRHFMKRHFDDVFEIEALREYKRILFRNGNELVSSSDSLERALRWKRKLELNPSIYTEVIRKQEVFRNAADDLELAALPFASRLFFRTVQTVMSFWDWLRGKIREANNVLTLYCPIADEITLDCKI